MVSRRTELQQLRQEIAQKQRNAGKKISRIKSTTGAVIAGTDFDVRRSTAKVKGYTKTQLKAYAATLDTFTSRKTQFVSDGYGKPMKDDRWKYYKGLENRYNRRVNAALDAVGDLQLPNSEQSLHERMMLMMPSRSYSGNPAVNVAYRPPVRLPKSITSAKSLERLIEDMENRLDPEHERGRLAKDKGSLMKTLRDAGLDYSAENQGDKDDPMGDNLLRAVERLTEKQFAIVWKYTSLANDAFMNYLILQAINDGNYKETYEKTSADAISTVKELIKWAGTL